MYPRISTTKIGPRLWVVNEDTTVFGVEIPQGYIFDGVSSPRMFWWLLPPAAEGFASALVHDYRHTDPPPGMTRHKADQEFINNLKREELSSYRIWLIWLGLRLYAYLFNVELSG